MIRYSGGLAHQPPSMFAANLIKEMNTIKSRAMDGEEGSTIAEKVKVTCKNCSACA